MKKHYVIPLSILLSITALSCKDNKTQESIQQKVEETNDLFSIEYIADKGKQIINESASIDIIGDGFTWTEGPLWIEDKQMLLFSDVPENKVYKWTQNEGITTYLTPSGLTNKDLAHDGEMGSNGLLLNNNGQLVLCQHGNRALAIMDTPLDKPEPKYSFLAVDYNGKKLNSPNDVIQDSKGNYYFTDPDYGISNNEQKEQNINAVYKLDTEQQLSVYIDSISHPNGLAFSPDESKLYITNSNPDKALLYEYSVDENKNITAGKIFHDFKPYWKQGLATPDGLKVDPDGNIFTSAPGGIWVFTADGELVAKINTKERASNCSLSQDGKTIFITTSDKVLRIKMR